MVKSKSKPLPSTASPHAEWIIEKIGGTSMNQFAQVLDHIFKQNHSAQKSAYRPYGRVIIVSAYGGVTDRLLENKHTRAPGIYRHFAARKSMRLHEQSILRHLKAINKNLVSLGLNLKDANAFIEQRTHDLFRTLDDLQRVLATGYVIQENILLAAREILASIGEVHSAYNTANILRTHDLNAVFVDLSGFQDHRAITIDERVHTSLAKLNFKTSLPILTGYVKGIEGIMRQFDRGYSDMTLAKVASHIHAREAVLYKEFHLSSADPKIVGSANALPVGQTNYDVADQLADVGMEAIHPSVSKILEKQNITLRIRNTFENDHQGTVMTRDYLGRKAKIEIIAGSNQVTLIEVHDPQMVGTVGADYDLATILKNHDVSYILKATNANSISQVVRDADLTPAFIRDIKHLFPKTSIQEVAVVSVIGTNIAIPGIMAKATTALSDANISILCVSQSLRQVNMQFVIGRQLYEKAIRTLHKQLITPPK